MALVETVLSSNLIQLFVTFTGGAGLHILFQRRYWYLFNVVGYCLAGGIFYSFLFNVGEVYPYSDYYKRAFFFFGDDITTFIILLFCFAVLSRNAILSVLLSSAVFMSGGKISFLLLMVMLYAIYLANKRNGVFVKYGFFQYIVIGVCMFFFVLFASNVAERSGFSRIVRDVSFPILEYVTISDEKKTSVGRKASRNGKTTGSGKKSVGQKAGGDRLLKGGGACSTTSHCFDTQIKAAVLQRYYSSLAGLWMTLEGGYRGVRYPASSDDFADLMVRENPWGINDKYDLDFDDWRKMGGVQNPYLRFGSGYGPWFLLGIVTIFFIIGVIAVSNILDGESGPPLVFTIFYLVIVVLNQTQSWLASGSLILIALGFCASHILGTWLSRRFKSDKVVPPFGAHSAEGGRA